MIECPNPNCHSKSFINKDASYFVCPGCQQKLCAICFGDWKQHETLNCNDYQKLKKKTVDDIFEKLMKEKKWRRCPNCQFVIEKTEYCNFMRCRLSICQKRFCFCYCVEKV